MDRFIRLGVVVVFVAGVLFAPASLAAAADKAKADERSISTSAENELGLTQEQKDKLKAMRESMRNKQEALRNDLRIAKEALQKELDSPNPDRKKADNLVASVNKLQTQVLALRVDQVFSMRTILTPEQYEKLIKEREKRRQNMKTKVQQGKPKFSGEAKPASPKGKK